MKSLSPLFLTCAMALTAIHPGVSSGAGPAAIEPTSAVSTSQAASQDNGATSNLSGTWQVSFTGKRGNRQATMQLKENGSKLSGSFEGERGSAPVNGSLNGSQISFTVKMPRREVSFTGNVDGNKMSGSTEQGGTWTATHQ